MTPEPATPKSADWLETFKQQYDLDKVPETSRADFDDFLLQRAAIREYYLKIPAEKLNEGIGAGDSPRTELIHQIGHSLLRVEGLETGVIANWRYDQTHPEEQAALTQMDREALIQALDETTVQLYTVFTKPETEVKDVQMPYGQKMTGIRLLRKVAQHDTLHAGMLVKFGDHFGIPRPAAMKKAWG